MAEIRVQNLHKAFADFTAVKDSSFTVRDGEFFCLLGPSGCGKTTTLRMIAGLELPTSGQIFLGDEDVSFKRASHRDIAFVFQLFALYPHMNVRRNIAFPLVSQGMPRTEVDHRVAEAARVLRIEHLIDKPVSGLSSGDRQRVALGRAIVRQPLAFLMDEPLGALDSEFRELMCQELRALHDRLHATTVYVTHDQLEAMAMADTIAIMNQGVIEQLGAPKDVYDRPASVFVADFIGSPAMNFLPFDGGYAAGTEQVRIGEAVLPVPALREDAPGGKLLFGVRPEHVRISPASGLGAGMGEVSALGAGIGEVSALRAGMGVSALRAGMGVSALRAGMGVSALRAEVLGTEYLGTSQVVTCTTVSGTTLRAKVDVDLPVQRGDHVGLTFDARQVSLFDQASGRALRTARHDASPTRRGAPVVAAKLGAAYG